MNSIRTCKYCGELVIWIITKNGKPTLCDASEVRYKSLASGPEVFVTEDGRIVRGREVERGGDGLVHRPHFASCIGPNADKINSQED